MCEACGTPNYVLKARRLGLTTYSVKHQPKCAAHSGRMCDCDPELVPVKQMALALSDC